MRNQLFFFYLYVIVLIKTSFYTFFSSSCKFIFFFNTLILLRKKINKKYFTNFSREPFRNGNKAALVQTKKIVLWFLEDSYQLNLSLEF